MALWLGVIGLGWAGAKLVSIARLKGDSRSPAPQPDEDHDILAELNRHLVAVIRDGERLTISKGAKEIALHGSPSLRGHPVLNSIRILLRRDAPPAWQLYGLHLILSQVEESPRGEWSAEIQQEWESNLRLIDAEYTRLA